jgi:hypothetical protein
MKDFFKQKWQIALAAIASLVVIACQIAIMQISPEPKSILDGIAKMSSAIVALMVFAVAASAIFSNSRKQSFEEVLDSELDRFTERHSPFIKVIEDYTGADDTNGALYGILEHHEDLLKKGEEFPADLYTDFFSLPAKFTKGNQIIFYFDEDTFAAAIKEKGIGSLANLRKDVANAISSEFSDIVKAHAFSDADDRKVYISLNKDFDTPEEAYELMHLLDYVFIHYLAIA